MIIYNETSSFLDNYSWELFSNNLQWLEYGVVSILNTKYKTSGMLSKSSNYIHNHTFQLGEECRMLVRHSECLNFRSLFSISLQCLSHVWSYLYINSLYYSPWSKCVKTKQNLINKLCKSSLRSFRQKFKTTVTVEFHKR